MAGPLAIADQAGRVAKAISQDLVVINGRWFREVRMKVPPPPGSKKGSRSRTVKVLEPVEAEFHVNPVSIGLGALALAAAGGLAWVAWNGLSLPTPFGPVQVFPGAKESPTIARFLGTHLPGVLGPSATDRQTALDEAGIQTEADTGKVTSSCGTLQEAYTKEVLAIGSAGFDVQAIARHQSISIIILDEARKARCPWTKGL